MQINLKHSLMSVKRYFEELKPEFEFETGQKWEDDINTYINYVNMRVREVNTTANRLILSKIEELIKSSGE